MTRIRKLTIAAIAAAAATAAGLGLLALPASATSTTVTASTAITGRDDSGNNGNWALDAMTRSVTATLIGLHSGSECGSLNVTGPDTCYQFTGSVEDTSGTFATDPGAFTPNQHTPGLHIAGESALDGTFSGGSASGFTFYADSNALSTTRVPSTVNGDGPIGTSSWMTLLFPAGTHFNGDLLPGWSWSYAEPVFCGHWTDAFNNGDGNLAADGNITGVSQCTLTVTNPGAQATQVNHAASLQIGASTTSSDKTLSFAASGLPAGLGINAATGVISGTPTAVENTDLATVTVSDAVGDHSSVTFAWSVTATPPPVASKLTARDVCGAYTGRHWKVSDVAGGRNRSFEYFTLLNSGRWLMDGSASVAAGGSVTVVTHRGSTLRLRWGNGLGRIVTAAFPVTTTRAC